MPFGPSSWESVFAQPITPGRYVFESSRPSLGSFTADDVMLTTRPRPLFRSSGSASRVSRRVDISVSSQAARQASSSKSSKPPAGGPPVLLTTMSSLPNRSSVRVDERLAASAGSGASRRDGERRGARSERLDLGDRLVEQLGPAGEERDAAALACQRRRAQPRPMPDEAPPTIATHP